MKKRRISAMWVKVILDYSQDGDILTRNRAVPVHEIQGSIGIFDGLGNETERVVFSPSFPFFLKPSERYSSHFANLSQRVR